MKRRTRSVERSDKKSSGFFGRKSKSVERPVPKRHNALMHDDDESYDSRNTGSRKHQTGASTRSNFLGGDDDSAYSKKSGSGGGWFGGGSTSASAKTKGKKDWREEEIAAKHAHERAYTHSLVSVNDIERLAQKRGQNLNDERFRVMPDEAYPNTYFNRAELRNEMNQKSVYFHDTRVRADKAREVGQLRLEILQCFGLPATSLVREVAAYCIAVCGSHAFKTDLMPSVANPMWLCKMRRACLFPVHHAYARLFIGVFDNSSENSSDFIGRVVIDIARLRAGCCYDFTLPLRQSSNVFTREQHGAVRVRLHLLWHTERNVIMSYIPKTKPEFRPQEKINVSCLDEQSFRNVAHTVHGLHMPGKFSISLLKATVREVNFTRIHVMRYLRKRELYNLIYWQYPLISGFVFLAWMHSVYSNTVRYIPGHIVTFLLLHLYKNYAYYAMDSPLQNGFMAPTIEELFNAALFGTRKAKKKYIQPLTMEVDQSHAINPEDHLDAEDGYSEANHNSVPLSEIAEALRKSIKLHTHKYRLKTFNNCFIGSEAVDFLVQFGYAYTRPEAVALGRKLARDTRLFEHVTKRYDFEDKQHYYQFLSFDTKRYVIKGHRPKFKRVLRTLFGFSEEDPLLATRGHVEFPFATGVDHPRFTVKEALVIRSTEAKKLLKEKTMQQDIVDCAEFGIVPAPPPDPNAVKAQQFITNAAGEVVNVAATLTTGVMTVGMGAVGGAVGVVRAGVRRASLLGGGPALTPTAKVEEPTADDVEKQPDKPKRRQSFSGGSQAAVDQLKMEVSADPDDVYSKLKSRNNPTLDELLERQANANAFDKFAYDSDDDVEDMYKKKSKGFIIEEKILRKPPNQDMSIKAQSGDKTFEKTMADARHKAHGVLLHLFNDRAYMVNQDIFAPTLADDSTDRMSVENGKDKKRKKINILLGAFGGGGHADRDKDDEEEEDKKKRKRQITPYDAKLDEFDKVLGINKYSHPNPWINRVGIIVQPIVEIVQSWLYMIRALFNIFTWQDPILSCWIAVLGPLAVLVLHVMPYRIFFFLLGVAAVGPQNYLLRLFRESKGDPPPDFDKLFKKKKAPKEERTEESQYFSSEAPGNQNIKYVNVDPKQVRNVVVPYGPLKYNRFYDWPPEPQYARVYASLPPRSSTTGVNGELYDEDESDDEGYEIDARTVKAKKKKKKKGIKKLASQVKKGTGTVVVAGGELAKRTQKITAGTVTGAVGLAGGAVMGTAHLTTTVAKGAVGVTKGAVKGTVKGAAKGAKGMLNIGKRGNKYDYDDDDSY